MITQSRTVPAPALGPRDRAMYHGAVWLFIIAEAMIFVTLFGFRFVYLYGPRPDTLDYGIGLAVGIGLLLSAIPVAIGQKAMKNDNSRTLVLSNVIAALIGLGMTVVVFIDWFSLPFSAHQNFGGLYVITTAYHVVHMLIGVVILFATASSTARGKWHKNNYWTVRAGALFWYFVVLMWVGVYIVLYVL